MIEDANPIPIPPSRHRFNPKTVPNLPILWIRSTISRQNVGRLRPKMGVLNKQKARVKHAVDGDFFVFAMHWQTATLG